MREREYLITAAQVVRPQGSSNNHFYFNFTIILNLNPNLKLREREDLITAAQVAGPQGSRNNNWRSRQRNKLLMKRKREKVDFQDGEIIIIITSISSSNANVP